VLFVFVSFSARGGISHSDCFRAKYSKQAMVESFYDYYTLNNITAVVLFLLLSLALSFDISGEKSMEAVLIISQPKAFVYG